LSLGLQIISWVLFLVLAAGLLRPAWGRLFGPVFLFDLVRSTRRSNFALLRSGYAAAILLVLFAVYSVYVESRAGSLWETLWSPSSVPFRQITRFSETFFYTFAGVQFAAIVLLTPVCTAGAIAEEKELRTLEFLLATDLGDREIVLGKLASRLGYLALFILTGLPILSSLQFLGGIDPRLVLADFAATSATLLSLTGLSMASSVYAGRTRGAVFLAYLWIAGYFVASSCCFAPVARWTSGGSIIIAVGRALDWGGILGGGNDLLLVVLDYVAFQLLLAVGCCAWAASRLRLRSANRLIKARGLPSTNLQPVTDHLLTWHQARAHARVRPPVGNDALVWKEIHADPSFAFTEEGRAIATAFTLCGMLLGIYVLMLGVVAATSTDSLQAFTNALARYGGTFVACMMLLGVALRASAGISGERDRRTLDALLVSPLSNRSILYAKSLGSILSVRRWWFVLGPLWGLGVITGGVHVLAVPLLLIAWVVYAQFVTNLGLCFSLFSRNTLRATIATIVAVIALSYAPWGSWSIFTALSYPRGITYYLAWVSDFAWYGLTPPITLGALAVPSRGSGNASGRPIADWTLLWAVSGIGCYALAAFALWRFLIRRFPRITRRMPIDGLDGSPLTTSAGMPDHRE
jgi:ABC-type transport system involved in multi-copper enzyme maturation permease subunit